MKSEFIVTEISDGKIFVSPVNTDSELNSENQNVVVSHIEVRNPRKFNVETGSKVKVRFNNELAMVLGFLAVIVPLAVSCGAYFSSILVSKLLDFNPTEMYKFLVTGIVFLASYFLLIRISRNTKTIIKPRITQVYTA